MRKAHTYTLLGAAGMLTCTAVALAQNPPANPNPSQPPRPHQPASPPGQQTPPRDQPGARPSDPGARGGDFQGGYMQTPKYAQRLTATLAPNTIQVWADNDFKGEQSVLEGQMRGSQTGTLQAFPENFDNAITSLQWNLDPGVLVVLFEDDTGKGQQLALWGKGQIPNLGHVDFNETASRWCRYDIGGGATPRSAGDIQLPHGAQPSSEGAASEGTIVLFDDQNFMGEQVRVTGLSGMKAGEWHTFQGEDEKENAASSIRWNLPEGVVVIFAAEDGGNDNIVIFGQGQNADLGQCDFDNKASRWSWAYIGDSRSSGQDSPPRQPGMRDPNAPGTRDPNDPGTRNPTNPGTRDPDDQ